MTVVMSYEKNKECVKLLRDEFLDCYQVDYNGSVTVGNNSYAIASSCFHTIMLVLIEVLQ